MLLPGSVFPDRESCDRLSGVAREQRGEGGAGPACAQTCQRWGLFKPNLAETNSPCERILSALRLIGCMKKLMLFSVGLLAAASVSHAGVCLSFGIGLPLPAVGVVVGRPACAYVAPRPVYYAAPAPVYVAPPVYYTAAPAYYVAPAAVYVAPPAVVVAPAPLYYGTCGYAPGYRYGRGYYCGPGYAHAHGWHR